MQLFDLLSRIVGMGRRPRTHFEGAVYHVMARGVDGRAIYVDDKDRTRFLDELNRIAAESSAEVIAYCLMGNHFHLAIRVGAVPLAAIMQRILTGYSLVFNRRHDREGHLFQARYKAILCLEDAYLIGLVRYIHLNPVRAGMVARPKDWPWSSWGLRDWGESEEAIEGFEPWPSGEVIGGLLRRDCADRRTIDEIGAGIVASTGIPSRELQSKSRRRTVIAAKRLFAREAVKQGFTMVEISKWLDSDRSSVSRYVSGNTAHTGRPDTKIDALLN